MPPNKFTNLAYRPDADITKALARDLGLREYGPLKDAIYQKDPETDDDFPTSPTDVPLSKCGAIGLLAYSVFSSTFFLENKFAPPEITIFPDVAQLTAHFLGPQGIGASNKAGVVDSLLVLGLRLYHKNAFVAGPLEDEDFVQYLQTLSVISATDPSPTLRYHAHLLTSAVLHAHPVDRTRLGYITDTLYECPFETLQASSVGWLKEEIMTAKSRNSDNIFSDTTAVAVIMPFLFPDLSGLAGAEAEEAWEEVQRGLVLYMATINFLYFLTGEDHRHVVPDGMMEVVERIYLGPLRSVNDRLLKALSPGGELVEVVGETAAGDAKAELDLLGSRMDMLAK